MPTKLLIDAATGDVTEIELTQAELDQRLADDAVATARSSEEAQWAALHQAILDLLDAQLLDSQQDQADNETLLTMPTLARFKADRRRLYEREQNRIIILRKVIASLTHLT